MTSACRAQLSDGDAHDLALSDLRGPQKQWAGLLKAPCKSLEVYLRRAMKEFDVRPKPAHKELKRISKFQRVFAVLAEGRHSVRHVPNVCINCSMFPSPKERRICQGRRANCSKMCNDISGARGQQIPSQKMKITRAAFDQKASPA